MLGNSGVSPQQASSQEGLSSVQLVSYGLNLEGRILNKILYEVDNSDITQ
jgi:hypothetical protein